MFACWKNGTQATDGLVGMTCASFVTAIADDTNSKLSFDLRLFKSAGSEVIDPAAAGTF